MESYNEGGRMNNNDALFLIGIGLILIVSAFALNYLTIEKAKEDCLSLGGEIKTILDPRGNLEGCYIEEFACPISSFAYGTCIIGSKESAQGYRYFKVRE